MPLWRFLASLFGRDASTTVPAPAVKAIARYSLPATPAASVKLAAFACPTCGAHTAQTWYQPYARRLDSESQTPFLPDKELLEAFEKHAREEGDQERRKMFDEHVKWTRGMLLGLPFIKKLSSSKYVDYTLDNVFISRCYTCSELALWVHDRLLFPPTRTGPPPNPDLPQQIRRDYEEASTVLDLSPRGAAAMLRLAIEKLCEHVGAQGDDINARIAWLVARGLPEKIQQALDAVRVIGNEAVHPGQLDLRDDRDTASELFDLVNIIADEMISRPERVKAVYNKIPQSKKAAIDKRDKAAK